jgi:hypothetical protein
MNISRARSAIVFGLCVTTAAVSSGCAYTVETPVHRVPMAAIDLNYFQPDCRIKQQQIEMLQSMRQSGDEQLFAYAKNITHFWQKYTNEDEYRRRDEIGSGEINRQINYNLQLLRFCP